jgi:threonine/homoserine/homoserine lactone efflux protein
MDPSFIATVILISLSGVMAPGPLFAATIAEGRRNKFAGVLISLGHATVEVPIIVTLFLFGTIIATEFVKAIVGFLGGIVLLFLAYSELKSFSSNGDDGKSIRGFLTGVVMSSFNPYFIIWWLTIGFALVMQSLQYGLIGLLVFIIVHEFCDFSWLSFVAYTSNKASNIWGKKARKMLAVISVSIFMVFGAWFLVTSISTLIAYL